MNKKRWKYLFYFIISIFFIFLIINTDFGEIIDSVKKIDGKLLILLFSLQLITEFLLTYQWHCLAKLMELETGFMKMLYINGKGTIMDGITPGAKVGGEFTRAYNFSQVFGYTGNESASLVGLQKLISISSLVGMGLLALLIPNDINIFSNNIYISIVIILSVISLFFIILLAVPNKIRDYLKDKDTDIKGLYILKNWIIEFSNYIVMVKGKKRKLILQFLLSIFIWGLFPYKLVLITKSFGVNNIVGLFATTLISYLVAMIPILPGGLGSFEMTMSGILLLLGLSKEESLVVSIGFRFITFWFVFLLSFLIVGIGNIVRRYLYEEKRNRLNRVSPKYNDYN